MKNNTLTTAIDIQILNFPTIKKRQIMCVLKQTIKPICDVKHFHKQLFSMIRKIIPLGEGQTQSYLGRNNKPFVDFKDRVILSSR